MQTRLKADYTQLEKDKLAGVQPYAQVNEVTGSNVIAKINASPETEQIAGSRVDLTGPSAVALASGKIFVGNASNVAQQQSVSGDATLSNTGVLTIANDAVTLAKIQNIDSNRILGRITAATGDVEQLTGAHVRTISGLATTDSPTFAGLTLTSYSGVLKATAGVVAGGATTSNLPEGANQYFTNARAQAAITGAASTIVTANLTVSRALASDASGKVTVSATTATELGYVSGVTSAVQTQLNGKQPIDATLTALAGLDATAGLVVQTGADAFTKRSIVGGTGVTVSNGSGAAGNPSIAIGQAVGTGDAPTFAGLTLTGDLAVNGGDLTSTASTFNLLNSGVTTANLFGAATSLTLGATTGTATLRNATVNFSNATALQLGGTTWMDASRNLSNIGTIYGGGSLIMTGNPGVIRASTIASGQGALLQLATGASLRWQLNKNTTAESGGNAGSNLLLQAYNDAGTFLGTVLDVTRATGAMTIGSFGDAFVNIKTNGSNRLSISGTGNTTLTGDLAVNGGDLTSTATTFNLLNSTVTTLNVGGAADVNIGGSAKTVTVAGNFATANVSSHLIPSLTDTYDLGSSTKLWRKGYLSELDAVLFAENTITLLGGWFYVTPDAGTLPTDVDNVQTTIDFGKAMTLNAFVVFRAAGAVEYMQVGTLVSGTTYNVTRNLDGSGANSWVSGTPFAVLGTSGQGRIELNAYDTPRISVMRQGATYNAQTELIRIGDLNGLAGIVTAKNGFYLSNGTNAVFYVVEDGTAKIAGWDFNNTSISAANATLHSSGYLLLGTANDIARLDAADATYRLWIGNAAAASAPFRVTKAGALTATSATITGAISATSGWIGGTGAGAWQIETNKITSAGIELNSYLSQIILSGSSAEMKVIGQGALISVGSLGEIQIGMDVGGQDISGLKINDYNYWWTDGKHKFGGASAYVLWDGSSLFVQGAALSAGTITGSTIQTASSGNRVVIGSGLSSEANTIKIDGTTPAIYIGTGIQLIGSFFNRIIVRESSISANPLAVLGVSSPFEERSVYGFYTDDYNYWGYVDDYEAQYFTAGTDAVRLEVDPTYYERTKITGALEITGAVQNDALVYPVFTKDLSNEQNVRWVVTIKRYDDAVVSSKRYHIKWWFSTSEAGAPAMIGGAQTVTAPYGGYGSNLTTYSVTTVNHAVTNSSAVYKINVANTHADTLATLWLNVEVQGIVYSSSHSLYTAGAA